MSWCLKQEFKKKLEIEPNFFFPKLKLQKIKKNRLISYVSPLLGDYIFCYDKKLEKQETLAQLKFVKGLKYILTGFSNSQDEIIQFINQCKKYEDSNGYITQNFFQPQKNLKYKFAFTAGEIWPIKRYIW